MDAFYERLIVRAATIDELLSDDFEPLPGQKGETDLAARRLAAWCRSCASGDWSLFSRRLARDGLAIDEVLTRFATVRRKASATPPGWIDDAIWIVTALESPEPQAPLFPSEPCAFENLFMPVVNQAGGLLRSNVAVRAFENLSEPAHSCLSQSLLKRLCELSAPAIYERFAETRKSSDTAPSIPKQERAAATLRYHQFVAEMRSGGFRRLFEDKPVLLRLLAAITRQWIETSREFILRLDADLSTIRRDILRSDADNLVARIEGDLSDPHNGGHSVQIVTFTDGSRVVYKPKDLRVEVAWHNLIRRLNLAGAPIELKTVRTLARGGYGWAEFIGHAGCADRESCQRFFRRAGAWLALFHCFVTNDMHQENIIAAGEYPVPIDLETILQSTIEEHGAGDPEAQAFDFATEKLANSVTMVGLLPTYGRSPDNKVFSIGGMTADWNSKIEIKWESINTDEMRPIRSKESNSTNPNLPHVDGNYAMFADHIDDFISGFEDYAKFLQHQGKDSKPGQIFDGFGRVVVRKIIRATRFYSMLLQRLKNHRTMDDGVLWSAQSDFIARLADWEKDTDIVWPLQRTERSSLLALNIPHFVSPVDQIEIRDATGVAIRIKTESGLDRAQARAQNLDEDEIKWQIEVIKENTSALSIASGPAVVDGNVIIASRSKALIEPDEQTFIREADKIADELSAHAIRRGPGAAWIGRDWLGDAEVSQLVCLGPDLYNGVSGIAVFLAAHAAVSGHQPSGELALASVSHLRKNLRDRTAARMARSLGVGGATGLGSVVYALTVMSKCLRDNELLADAHVAADLFTDDLIAADKELDVIGGSAGAVLCLLRLYRDGQSAAVLRHAARCGEHLIAQVRQGQMSHRSWVGQASGQRALNGMSHGAAGFAYALASLSAATGREEFRRAAAECIEFENATYSPEHKNWPDFRTDNEPSWPSQWCHGATGIGLARIATARQKGIKPEAYTDDIKNAVDGAQSGWRSAVDTLCCGTLGNIEFFCEASKVLGRSDLRELALARLSEVLTNAASGGDYRWSSGHQQFNLGLFRGLSGVGYTVLRRVDSSLPNVLIWE
jgi:type 2 lantibiotic biosynthesis protein LanM